MFAKIVCLTLLVSVVIIEGLLQARVNIVGDVNGIHGCLLLRKFDDGVEIQGKIYGLEKGSHGFHVHQFGDLCKGCKSAGGHFNPQNKTHGGPNDAERHVGDLGNIEADSEGVANVCILDKTIDLQGKHSIIGRSIVIHADPDDFGKGGKPDSLTTGHAGARVACGVIGIA